MYGPISNESMLPHYIELISLIFVCSRYVVSKYQTINVIIEFIFVLILVFTFS